MITLHGEEVKVGDRVWDITYGWGEVVAYIDFDKNHTYPICVEFKSGAKLYYTSNGLYHINDINPSLFWQPVEFEIPKKPKQKEKAWQWVCRGGVSDTYWLTHCYYASKEDVLERNSNAEPIEPYLPSEVEREKPDHE